MYKVYPNKETSINRNKGYQGETIEGKVRRILSNKEPITDGAPIIYTERKDGVLPSYNIRTDRFEVAVEAMQGISKQHIAKREGRAGKVVEMTKKEEENITKGESTQNTAETQ
ncbi:MAG: hypothetical protein [Microviridae sp.]|nr:MAG: hypothetical protein [Microviridae sp.]